ncbi:zinc finger BED domain-containing protein 5-like, partial [Myzus persicae]|uniref:zinc finger BED domain-containing protein 5-like n=1 Tax=Myzus persicae TaxID=13164 RepID=UPI000B9307B2
LMKQPIVIKDAYLICYVRFMDGVDIIDELLFCTSILSGTKAKDLFDITNNFMDHNYIKWENCLGVCTNGARAMSGQYGGLQALIRQKVPEIIWTYFIKVVNYVKTRPVKARFFQKLCEEMGAEHTTLLFYCNSRWLSKGNVLSRVFELRQELYSYLNGEGKETHILQLYDKIVAFFKKFNLWKRKLTEENGKTTCFPLLKYFLGENDLQLPMSLNTTF